MPGTLRTLRDALYDLVKDIDISSAADPEDELIWRDSASHPIKQFDGYPAFFVTPARNEPPVTVDTATQEVPYTFSICIYNSFEDAADADDMLVDIADLVFDALLAELKGLSPLEEAAFDGTPSGEWGFEQETGERFYRIEVTARTIKEIELVP